MMNNILIFTLLVGACFQQTYTQRSSSTSSSSFSSSSFTSTLETSAQQSAQALEADPNDLDAALQNIALGILPELESIAQALISGGSIDAQAISLEFGSAVNTSLSLVATGKVLGKLDVESVVAEVESSVESILMKVDEDSEVVTVTEDLGNAVIGAIGNGFAEATGGTFSFKVIVSATTSSSSASASTRATSTASSSSSSVTSTTTITSTNDGETSFSVLLSLLEANDTAGVVAQMEIELKNNELKVLEFFIAALQDATLYDSLVSVFVEIFADEKFSFDLLIQDLTSALEINKDMGIIIEQAMIQSLQSGNVDGISILVSLSLSSQSFLRTAFVSTIESVIEKEGCSTELSEILIQSSDDASNKQAFTNSVAGSASLSECLSKGQESQLSFSVVTSLFTGDIQVAYESLAKAQISTIVASFIFGIEEGYDLEVSQLMLEFFSDETVTTEKLSFIIALFMSQNSSSSTTSISFLLDVFSQIDNIETLIMTFQFALNQGEPQVQSAFVELIAGSVKNSECGLFDVVSGVLDKSTSKQADDIKALLEEADTESCFMAPATKGKLPPTVIPEAEPTPEVESQPSPPMEDVSPTLSPVSSKIDDGTCVDIAPPGGYTCEQQVAFGKCVRKWMSENGFCAKSCGYCCEDIQPDDRHTCAQQKDFGKCDASWMIEGGFCQQTCGSCNGARTPTPSPTSTPTLAPEEPAQPTPSPPQNTPALAAVIPAPTQEKGKCDCDCDNGCGCGCGCSAQMTVEMTAQIVKDVVMQVLKELQN